MISAAEVKKKLMEGNRKYLSVTEEQAAYTGRIRRPEGGVLIWLQSNRNSGRPENGLNG